jgi:hypothetical protein
VYICCLFSLEVFLLWFFKGRFFFHEYTLNNHIEGCQKRQNWCCQQEVVAPCRSILSRNNLANRHLSYSSLIFSLMVPSNAATASLKTTSFWCPQVRQKTRMTAVHMLRLCSLDKCETTTNPPIPSLHLGANFPYPSDEAPGPYLMSHHATQKKMPSPGRI